MQSTRAFNMLRQRAMPAFRAQPVRNLRLQASPKMRSPVPVCRKYKPAIHPICPVVEG